MTPDQLNMEFGYKHNRKPARGSEKKKTISERKRSAVGTSVGPGGRRTPSSSTGEKEGAQKRRGDDAFQLVQFQKYNTTWGPESGEGGEMVVMKRGVFEWGEEKKKETDLIHCKTILSEDGGAMEARVWTGGG